jgi:C4-dicarboxylate-binding protein DctP
MSKTEKEEAHMSRKLLFLGLVALVLVGFNNTSDAAAKYVIKFAHNQQIDSPQHKGVAYFKQILGERSKGDVEVQIYPASQLGGMREATEGVQNGTIEMSQQPTSILGNFSPAFGIVDMPFLWPNEKVLRIVLNQSPVGKELMSYLGQKGMKGFSFHGAGFKQLTANKPIRSPEDIKGLKYRVMPNPLLQAQFKAWGAHAIPMDFAELYNALQQKVIDGQENPFQSVRMLKFWEVQQYLSVTNHGYIAYGIIGNKRWFESLPKDVQDLISKCESEAAEKQLAILADEEKGYRKEIESHGMKVIDLTPEGINQFREASKPVHVEFAPKLGKEFFDRVVAEIGKTK